MTTVPSAAAVSAGSPSGQPRHKSTTPPKLLRAAALVAAVMIGLQSRRAGNPGIATVALVAGLVFAVAAAVTDARLFRLPNWYVAGVALSACIAGLALDRVGAVAVAALLGASPYLALHMARPGTLGFGDVKFAAALGGLVGVFSTGAVTVMLAAAFTLAAVIRWRRPHGAIALGPTIMAGALVAVAVAVSFQAAGRLS